MRGANADVATGIESAAVSHISKKGAAPKTTRGSALRGARSFLARAPGRLDARRLQTSAGMCAHGLVRLRNPPSSCRANAAANAGAYPFMLAIWVAWSSSVRTLPKTPVDEATDDSKAHAPKGRRLWRPNSGH